MAELVGSLNGQNIVEDYQRNASLIAVAKDWWIVNGLQVTKNWSNLEVSSWMALVKVKRGTIEFVVDVWNTSTKVITAPTGPWFVYFQVDETKVANWTGNNTDWTGVANIVFASSLPASYPSKFFVVLAQVDGALTVTDSRVMLPSVQETIVQSMQNAMYQSSSTGTNLAYSLAYASAVQSSDATPQWISEKAFYSFKAHVTNNGPITLTINTSAWNLTAPVKKLHDQDLQSWDIESGQTVFVTWNKAEGIFEMQSQLAQAPAWTVSTISSVGIVWEANGISIWKPVFIGSGTVKNTRLLTQTVGWSSYNMWNGNQIRLQQMILADTNNIVLSIATRIRKVGAPSDNVQMRIMNKDRTTVIATSTNVIAWGSIGTAFWLFTFNFNSVSITAEDRFIIEFIRTGAQDSSNYYQIESTANFEYPHWDIRYFDGTNFLQYDWSLYFSIQFGKLFTVNQWYESDSEYFETREVSGIAEQTKSVWQNISVTMEWVNSNQNWLVPWASYYLDTLSWDKNLTHNTETHFWHSVGNQEKLAQSIVVESGITIDRILLNLRRQGTPIDNFRIRIETDNNWVPSGTLAHANAVCTRTALSLVTSSNWRNDVFVFTGAFTLVAWVRYWIVFERTWGLDATNYYVTRIQNSNIYANGNMMTYTSSAWVTQTRDLFFSFLEQYNWLDLNPLGERAVSTPNADMFFGYSRTDRLQIAQMMMIDQNTPVSSIDIHMRKDWSPTDNVILTLETNVEEVDSTNTSVIGTTSVSSSVNFGTNTDQRQAFGIQSTQPWYVSAVDLYLWIGWVPTDWFTVRIETDSAGAPSWTLVNANATATVNPWTGLITSTNRYSVPFDKWFQLQWWVQYWLVLQRTWSLDNVNFFTIGKWAGSAYTGAFRRAFNGTIWSASTGHTGSIWVWVAFMRNKPSWDLVSPNAIITIPNASLTTSFQNLTFNFPWSFTIPWNTKVWLRLKRSNIWAVSTTNYYRVRTRNDNLYWYGYLLTLATANWNDSYYAHTIVCDFLKVYRRRKYLRVSRWTVPVGKALLSNQISVFAQQSPRYAFPSDLIVAEWPQKYFDYNASAMYEIYRFTAENDWFYRIAMQLFMWATWWPTYSFECRVFKNWVAYWTLRSVSYSGWASYSSGNIFEDLEFTKWDTISLYGRQTSVSSSWCWVDYFRIGFGLTERLIKRTLTPLA